jgi:hypothetical protein
MVNAEYTGSSGRDEQKQEAINYCYLATIQNREKSVGTVY